MNKLFLKLALAGVSFISITAMQQPANRWVDEIVSLANLNAEQAKEAAEEGDVFSYRRFRNQDLGDINTIIIDITNRTPINKTLIENVFAAYNEIEPDTAYKLRSILSGLIRAYEVLPEHDAQFAKEITNKIRYEISSRFDKILQSEADLKLINAIRDKEEQEKQKGS